MEILERKYTFEDYLNLPEGSNYQLINGELIMAPAPEIKHQQVSKKLFFILYQNVEQTGKGFVFYSPIDVLIDSYNVFQPDIVVILKENEYKIKQKFIEGAPDVVIEIISPSTAYYDLVEKKERYLKAGVKEYWIVDPKVKSVEILKNETGNFITLSKAVIKGVILSEIVDLKFEISEIF